MQVHRDICLPLDTCQHIHIHAMISILANRCRGTHSLATWRWVQTWTCDASHVCKHMLMHSQPCDTQRHNYTLSFWYKPAHEDTQSPVNPQNMPSLAHLQTRSKTLSSWYVPSHANKCPSCYVLTHAETCHALNARRYTLSLWYMYTHADIRNAHARSALDTWQRMKIPAWHLTHANKCT
jgi:hypothetical protein